MLTAVKGRGGTVKPQGLTVQFEKGCLFYIFWKRSEKVQICMILSTPTSLTIIVSYSKTFFPHAAVCGVLYSTNTATGLWQSPSVTGLFDWAPKRAPGELMKLCRCRWLFATLLLLCPAGWFLSRTGCTPDSSRAAIDWLFVRLNVLFVWRIMIDGL